MVNNNIGLIVLGENMHNEILLEKIDDNYFLPEITFEELSNSDNIVDGAIEYGKMIGFTPIDISLAYVVREKDGDDINITYYFILFTADTNGLSDNFHWLVKADEIIANNFYPKDFVTAITNGLKDGWIMGKIEVIEN